MTGGGNGGTTVAEPGGRRPVTGVKATGPPRVAALAAACSMEFCLTIFFSSIVNSTGPSGPTKVIDSSRRRGSPSS